VRSLAPAARRPPQAVSSIIATAQITDGFVVYLVGKTWGVQFIDGAGNLAVQVAAQ
jgi:hypothetical protein